MTNEIVKYDPRASIGSASNLKSLLERNKDSIGTLLPKHVTVDRIIKMALVAANRNAKLLQCTQASVIETIQRAAELGLDVSGTLGEAYPVPYENRKTGQTTCQLIIGYRGLAKLARQSGEIDQLEAEAVYENDTFVYQKGTDFKLMFQPKLDGDRGAVRGFYAYVKTKDGGHYADWMTMADVNKVRERSKAKDNGPWVTDTNEMGRKTVFRRLSKWLNLSSEKFNDAIETDNAEFEDSVLTKNVTPTPKILPGEDPIAALADQSILDVPVVGLTESDGGAGLGDVTWDATVADKVDYVVTPSGVVDMRESEPPAETSNGLDPEKFKSMLERVLGKSGPALVRTFMKSKFPGKKLFELTTAELDVLDKFVADTASRQGGAA